MANSFNKALTKKLGSVWIQPGGPNEAMYYLGCIDAADVTEPLPDADLIQCFDENGQWMTLGEIVKAPGAVTLSLDQLTLKARSWLEKVTACFSLYINMTNCGKRNVWENYRRTLGMANARVTSRKYGSAVAQDTDGKISRSSDIKAWPPVMETVPLTVQRLTTAEVGNFNDITGNPEEACADGCGVNLSRGTNLYACADATAGLAGKVWVSTDGGTTWASTAAQPFAAAVINSPDAIVRFYVGSTLRILCGKRGAGGAVQGLTAYSDDNGATWTLANLGAAVGHGVIKGGGIFALDNTHIWLASFLGFIYFSSDGGASWTAQESGGITAGAYSQIHFVDENYGMAVAAAGVTAVTRDGGKTWAAGGVVGAFILNSVQVLDSYHAWVAAANGFMYYTSNFGTTWTQRAGFPGVGVGATRDIKAVNSHVMFAIQDSAGSVGTLLRTRNGGLTWEAFTTPLNAGLNQIWAFDVNACFICGKLIAALGWVGKAAE